MKRMTWVAIVALALATSSCEMTREITIQSDGSGTYVSSVDMGGMLAMAGSFAGDATKELEGKKMDTAIGLSYITDSIPDLNEEQKKLAQKGTFRFAMDMSNSQFFTSVSIPFESFKELNLANQLTGKTASAGLMDMLAKGDKMKELEDMGEMGDMMPTANIDGYYTVEFKKGSIRKQLNAEKYANLESDESLKETKELSTQGMSPSSKLVIHLPKPAKKAEGAGVSLSDDKKTVTITESVEDFFDDGKKLEFLIEY